MKNLDDYVDKQIKTFPIALLISLIFIAFGVIVLIIKGIEGLLPAILLFGMGTFALVMNIKMYIASCKKKEDIEKVENLGTKIIAKIEEQKFKYPYGSVVICSAEINGNRYEFTSEPVNFNVLYACQELGVEGLPVYVNMENPEEYVVDIRELEDRVVDLT